MDSTVTNTPQTNSKLNVKRDPVKTVILASMMGTAIEFFDFYAYGTASAAYFPKIFFPQMTPLLANTFKFVNFWSSLCSTPDRFLPIWTLW